MINNNKPKNWSLPKICLLNHHKTSPSLTPVSTHPKTKPDLQKIHSHPFTKKQKIQPRRKKFASNVRHIIYTPCPIFFLSPDSPLLGRNLRALFQRQDFSMARDGRIFHSPPRVGSSSSTRRRPSFLLCERREWCRGEAWFWLVGLWGLVSGDAGGFMGGSGGFWCCVWDWWFSDCRDYLCIGSDWVIDGNILL